MVTDPLPSLSHDALDSDPLQCNGLLVVDKPAGISSRDVVNRIERLLRPAFPKPARLPKVGHAGTLDPMATGVLVVGIGAGVRLVPYIQQVTKTYHAQFRMGYRSETGDIDGIVETVTTDCVPQPQTLMDAAIQLTGWIRQVPPATSAIRVNGRKAYTYAHRGEAVTVPERTVWIESIQLLGYQYPDWTCSVTCGSGTYIRTLGQDWAIRCGTQAVMTALRRTAIGAFTLTQAVNLETLDLDGLYQALQPLALGVAHLPRLACSPDHLRRFCLGQKIAAGEMPPAEPVDSSAPQTEPRAPSYQG